jgi:prepilin-type N-terminal cleavage/methylation domain-containing protein
MTTQPNSRRMKRGFSLVEVMVLVVVLGIVGSAAGTALQAMIKSPGQTDQFYQIEMQTISKMEAIRALSFDQIALGNPNGSLTDMIAINNTYYQRVVTVTLADANGDGTVDATFKQITVTCGGQSVSTLLSR